MSSASINIDLSTNPDTTHFDNVSLCLRERPQWVLWQFRKVDGNLRKIPINVRTGWEASTTDAKTWAAFDEAVDALQKSKGMAGIGYVFSPDDPFTGIDFDNCRDPETGTLATWAKEFILALASYTEASPSGRGVHVIVRAKKKPGQLCRKDYATGRVEMYDQGRYFTMTGRYLPEGSAEVEERQDEVDALYRQVFGEIPKAVPNGSLWIESAPSESSLDDEAIIQRASKGRSGAKFQELWAGQWRGRYRSQSEADLALCGLLAFYTKDSRQLDRLFRRSGLMRPKWNEKR